MCGEPNVKCIDCCQPELLERESKQKCIDLRGSLMMSRSSVVNGTSIHLNSHSAEKRIQSTNAAERNR